MTTATCGSTILYGRPLRTYGKGRVCAHNGCDTIVSLYNPLKYCSLHEKLHRSSIDVDSILFTTKECLLCGCDKLANSDFWDAEEGTADGLSDVCRECTSGAVAA